MVSPSNRDPLEFADTMATCDVFDILFAAPSPLLPVPRLSNEELHKQNPDNKFFRTLYEIDAKKAAEGQKELEALGFSSWEEKRRHDEEERRKWLEDYVEEHGHSPPPRIYTDKEKFDLELQNKRSLADKLALVRCDCEEHLQPGFCPQKLRSYKSQGNDPDDFHFLQSLHPTNLNVRIRETDTSKRIPDWWLEHVWGMRSQDRVLRLPLWAKRDDTIQRMIDKEEVDDTLYYGDFNQDRRRPPPSRSVSLTPDFSAEEDPEAVRESERHCERVQTESQKIVAELNSKQASPEKHTKVNNAHASLSARTTTGLSGTQSHSPAGPANQRTRSGLGRKTSALEVKKTKGASWAQASGIKKRPAIMKEATRKAARSSRIQTRAQGVLSFLALDSRGCAISVPKH